MTRIGLLSVVAVLSACGPSQVGFSTTPVSVAVDDCSSAITVQLQDDGAKGSKASADVTVALTVDSGLVSFFSDSTCATAITSVAIPKGAESGTFFVKGLVAGAGTLTAAVDKLKPGTQAITVTVPVYSVSDLCRDLPGAVCAYYVRCGRAQTEADCVDLVQNRQHALEACGRDPGAAVWRDGRVHVSALLRQRRPLRLAQSREHRVPAEHQRRVQRKLARVRQRSLLAGRPVSLDGVPRSNAVKHFALIGLLVCALGCKSPREKYEEAARAQLAALPSLLEAAKAAPPIDEASAKALANVSGFKLKYQDSNALLIHLEELANPTLRRELPMRLNFRSPTVDLAEALKVVRPEAGLALETKYSPGLDSESNMSSVWQRMGELRFVLVVRTRELRDAALTGEKTFNAGAWAGEVLVFELATHKLLGGFPLGGTNHGSVKTADGRDTQNLSADLTLATRGNLNASVRKFIPGVTDRDEAN